MIASALKLPTSSVLTSIILVVERGSVSIHDVGRCACAGMAWPKGLAAFFRMFSTWDQLSVGFQLTMSKATPATCDAAMLRPTLYAYLHHCRRKGAHATAVGCACCNGAIAIYRPSIARIRITVACWDGDDVAGIIYIVDGRLIGCGARARATRLSTLARCRLAGMPVTDRPAQMSNVFPLHLPRTRIESSLTCSSRWLPLDRCGWPRRSCRPRVRRPCAVGHRTTREVTARTLSTVARILRIRVTAIPVVGDKWVWDEVISTDDAAGQINMGTMAGVNHSHDNAGIAGANVPGLRQVGFIVVSFFLLCC